MRAVLERGQTLNFYNAIVPIILSVFSVYLTIGIALGVLPKFVQNDIHFDSWVIGAVIGIQSLATLLSRAYFGKLTDTKGAKRGKYLGIILVGFSGIFYTSAVFSSTSPTLSLSLLILARLIHGIAESQLVIATLSWGIGLVGHERSGKVMTWNGIAMYSGIALGAPIGIWITNNYNITFTFLMVIVLPLLSLLFTFKLPETSIDKDHVRTPFYTVVQRVAQQGLGLAFASIAFACITSFIALLFTEKNWGDASLAFMVFGLCYVLTRVFFASLPDKYGAYRIALIFLIIEITGQLFIGFSSSKFMAIAGCGLTGMGFSLLFPSFGVLAIQKVSPQMRGTALGAYAAFFDLSLGLANPIAGLIAGWFNYQMIYVFGSFSCLMAILIMFYKKK